MKKKLLLLFSITICTFILCSCGGIKGDYYSITTGDHKEVVKVDSKTITVGGTEFGYKEEKDGKVKLYFASSNVYFATWTFGEFEGEKVIYTYDSKVPAYCKGEEEATKLAKAVEKKKKEEEKKEEEKREKKAIAEFEKKKKAMKEVYDSLPGTKWKGETLGDKKGEISFDKDKVKIVLKYEPDLSFEKKNAYTIEITGTCSLRADKKNMTMSKYLAHEGGNSDILVKPESITIDGQKKSIEDVQVAFSFTKDYKDDTYKKRQLRFETYLPEYPDIEKRIGQAFQFSINKI